MGLLQRVAHMAAYEGAANLMVQVALGTLQGVAEGDLEQLAAFAVEQVAAEKFRQEERRRVLIENFSTYRASGTTIPLYRASTLLLEGMQRTRAKPPLKVRKAQLFAALGLALLDAGLRTASEVPFGVVTWKLGGRERMLLDAAECIHAWQHAVDEGRKAREEWRQALGEFIRALHRENRLPSTAKEALRMFVEVHPAHEAKVANVNSFAAIYSETKKQVLA